MLLPVAWTQVSCEEIDWKSKDGSWRCLSTCFASILGFSDRYTAALQRGRLFSGNSGSVEKNFGCKYNDSGEDITSSKIVDIAQDVPVKNADAAQVASHAMDEFDANKKTEDAPNIF